MEEPKQLIPEITPDSKGWTVRITVTESISVMTCSNGSKLKRYIFTDKEGNEVVATIYGQEVDILCPMIHQYVVYDISNAIVKAVDKPYQILPAAYQWNIKKSTLIREIPNAVPTLCHFLDTITPFSKIADAHKAGCKTTDIMGIILQVDEIKQVNNGRNNVQHFTFIDPEKLPISVSIWDEMIATEGHTLVQAARNHYVVVAKRLAIKTFDCISLSSRNSSSFTINPPIEAATNMMDWFATLPQSEIESLKMTQTLSFTRDLVTTGRMRTYTLSEVENNVTTGDYWVRGLLRIVDDSQQLYYAACNNCDATITAVVGLKYKCFLCKQQVNACLKPIVIMKVVDQTCVVEVAALDNVAEEILKTTTDDMKKLILSGGKVDLNPIKEEFEGKTFSCLLRRTHGKNSNVQRRLILKAYFDDATSTTKAKPQPEGESFGSTGCSKSSDLPLSPLKRQLNNFGITSGNSPKKQLSWNESTKFEGRGKNLDDENNN